MKRSEKMLLGVFGALFVCIVLVGGGMFAFRNYLDVRDEVDLLRGRLSSMNLAVSQGAVWAERSAWIEGHVPSFTSHKDASARLLETVTQKARAHGMIISTTELIEQAKGIGADGELVEEQERHFDQASIKTTLTAVSEEPFFAWLHDLQSPESFLGVTRLQINPSGTSKTINVEIEFTQFYHEKSAPKVTKAN